MIKNVLLALLFTSVGFTCAASQTMTVTANVIAVCSLEAPATVNFTDIPASEFTKVSNGGTLTEYAQSVTLKSHCQGTAKYDLTFKADNAVYNGCYLSDVSEDFGFCLRIDGKETTMKTEGVTLTKSASTTDTEVIISPQRPKSAVPLSGTNTLTLNLTLSPN